MFGDHGGAGLVVICQVEGNRSRDLSGGCRVGSGYHSIFVI